MLFVMGDECAGMKLLSPVTDTLFCRYKEYKMSKLKLTKLEKSWVLYDVGHSAFLLLY